MSNDTDTNLVEGKYSIKDLIDIEELRVLFEEFAGATGFTIGFLDHPGLNVLIAAGWRDICTKFHRGCPATMENCLKSNRHLLNNLNVPGQTVIELCDNGLIDCATPVIIRGKHIASLATGQLFLREPDIGYFKKQAALYGFDEAQYLKAVKETPIVPEEKVRSITAYLGKLASFISEQGYAKLELNERNRELSELLASKAIIDTALKTSETKFKALFENGNDSIFVADIETETIIDANKNAELLTGRTRAELIGMDRKKLHPAGQVEYYKQQFQKHVSDGVATLDDALIEKKDGTLIPVQISASVMEIGGRKIIQGLFKDISRRKLEEEALLKSEKNLREAQRLAHIGNWDWDVATDTIIWSEEYHLIFGLDPAQQPPGYKEHLKMYTPESAARLDAVVKKNLETGESYEIDLELARTEGQRRWITARSETKRDALGRITGLRGTAQDITERKQMETNLRLSEQKFKGLAENIPDVVWETDENNIYSYVSPKIKEVLGYEPHELIGTNRIEFMSGDEDEDGAPNKFTPYLLQKIPFRNIEHAIRHKDGRLITMESSGDPFFNETGRYMGYKGVTRNITERKRLQDENNLKAILLDSVSDAIFLHARDGRIVYANKAACYQLGYSEDELLCITFQHVLAPGFQQQFAEQTQSTIKDHDVVFNSEHIRKNGSILHVETLTHSVQLDGEDFVLCVVRDITERVLAEAVLRDSEEKFRSLFENSHEALMTLAPPSWRFTSGNQAMAEMFGAKNVSEFLSLTPADVSPQFQPDGLPSDKKAKEMIETAMQKGTYFFEWTHKRMNGEAFPATVLLSRVEFAKKKFLLATVTDVTERNRAEQAIRQTAEIKSKFASMVSHELRSPLTAIMLGVSLILEETGNLSAEHRELLNLVHDNADRLGRLINNVLDMQKIAAGKMSFKIIENDINDAVQTTARSMDIMAKTKKLELITEISPGIPRAMFDKDRIIQVLTNLLSNAIAHTEKGGIAVHAADEGGIVHVSVRDTGHGIPAEELPKLFRPFEQVATMENKSAGGTGLGLAISKEIILAHSGKIWAESEPGKGSVFHFTLPLKRGGGEDPDNGKKDTGY